ncbi:MAG: multidrug effflux MFS transporter, partial [Pseudomonadota bacterium]
MSRGFLTGYTMALFIYGWLSVNMYLPILPQLEQVFDVQSRTAKLTFTVFMLGFAVSQLFWGPLSDRYGRKPVLLTGLAISVVGAVLSGLTPTIELFMATRFFEAVGLGVGPVLGRAVLAESLDRSDIAGSMAHIVSVVSTVPAWAPIIGGYVALWLSWHGIFFVLAVYGTGMWLLTRVTLKETTKDHVARLRLRDALHTDLTMLREPRYSGYLLFYGVAFGSLLGYYATTPYLFTRELGFASYQYGYLLIFNVAVYVSGVQISRVVVHRHGIDRPLLLALGTYAISATMFFVAEIFADLDVLGILIPISVFVFGAGLVSPAANAGAMTIFHERAGAATAFVGFAVVMGGA